MTKTILLILLFVPILNACVPTYSETLEKKLTGKTPDQQRTILAQECGSETAQLNPQVKGNAAHAQRMREICEEMTGNKVPVKESR